MKQELDREGIRPTSPDLECFHSISEALTLKMSNINQKQNEIQETVKQAERATEIKFQQDWIIFNVPQVKRLREKRIHTWKAGLGKYL